MKRSNLGRKEHEWRILILFIGLTAVTSVFALETITSDKPITVEQAEKKAGIRLPLSKAASQVRFSLTGETQNWNLFISFHAPVTEIYASIQAEVTSYKKRTAVAGVFPREEYGRGPILGSIQPSISRLAPKWWVPSKIKNGFFIGSSHPHGYGPHFWVDLTSNTVFYYEHF